MVALLLALTLGLGFPPAGGAHALDVLHGWDNARSAAYSRSDPAALLRLYVVGSRAGAADVRLLRAYDARGYRVTFLRPQIFSVAVLEHRRGLLRLRIVDRVTGAVMGHARCALLPAGAPRERDVLLRRVGGAWRVASVVLTDAGRGPPR